MTPTNNSSLTSTVRQLKEIIINLRGKQHESYALINEMERLVADIERKAKNKGITWPFASQGNSKLPLST